MKVINVAKRVGQLVLVLIGSTLMVSLLIRLLPVSLADLYVVNPDPVGRLADIHRLGLDKNPVLYYLDWLWDLMHGNFGNYIFSGGGTEPVSEHISRTLPVTLILITYVQIVALAVSIPLGLLSAYKVGKRTDRIISNILFTTSSIPGFVIALVMAFYVGVKLGWLPPLGYEPISNGIWNHLQLMILPVISLSVPLIASYTRLLRTDVIATLREDYITMAASKGLSNSRILWTHVFRPSSITLFTSAALNMGALIGGALVIETIFSIPGIGFEIYLAIQARQYIALQSYIAIIAIGYVFFNALVDIAVGFIDPRAREHRSAR